MLYPSHNISKEECDGALRRLELETYSNLISVFRAQGYLNNQKYKILEDMRKLLFITEERHRAEARRAANDEHLATIANVLTGPNSELQWLKEGKRLFPLLKRKSPLSSLTHVANSALKYSLNKKTQESSIKIQDKTLYEDNIDDIKIKLKTSSKMFSELHGKKNGEALKNLYSISQTTQVSNVDSNIVENKTIKNNLTNYISDTEIKINNLETSETDIKLDNVNNNNFEVKNANKIVNPLHEKNKIIVVGNENSKSTLTPNVSVVGNIVNMKRKSPEKLSELVDTSSKKCMKSNSTKEIDEPKQTNIQLADNIGVQIKVSHPQKNVSVQKIINPFLIENVKVPTNAINIKDLQNRKAVKLITAPNGKIFIQPAQGSSNRITNIRPLSTVIKTSQCIALKKVTALCSASEIQSKPIKIGKANMIIFPKSSLNKKQSEIEHIDFISKNQNVPKFTIQSTSSAISAKMQSTNELKNQKNVFVIGSIINQNIGDTEVNTEKIINQNENEIDVEPQQPISSSLKNCDASPSVLIPVLSLKDSANYLTNSKQVVNSEQIDNENTIKEDQQIVSNENQMETKSSKPSNEINSEDQTGFTGAMRRINRNRKKPSVRAKEKKIRQSRVIRKVLIPKNALMALHEVKNIKIDDFVITSNPGGGFQAIVTVNHVQYEGFGNSKNAAKSNVCEKALRDLVIAKMVNKPSRSNSMENLSNDVEMKEGNEGDNEEDDVPILNLASFALFKLFSEWESDGYEVPEFRPTPSNTQFDTNSIDKQERLKKQPSLRNELPVGWETMHPATLLCMMRPGLTYVDLGAEGIAPNQIQKTGVTVDDQHFIGTGKSKKIARKNAAGNACNTLFKTNFPSFSN